MRVAHLKSLAFDAAIFLMLIVPMLLTSRP
jgi:hypothetical protein